VFHYVEGGDEAGSAVMADSCVGWLEEARAAISARAGGSISSTLWSPKTFERADLKPRMGAAMGSESSGLFAN